MPFEFAFLDWLQQFHNPVLDALAVFLNYAGEHGEIWIAFTLLLLLFRRTRKAGCAMATALVLYLVAGDCILKPLFARPRPCDVNTAITILVKRPHGHSFPSGHTASAFAAAFALWLQNRKLGVPALVLAAFIAFTRLYLYVHFPTDVLGGLVLGLALGFFASWLVDSLANKFKKKQIVPTASSRSTAAFPPAPRPITMAAFSLLPSSWVATRSLRSMFPVMSFSAQFRRR